MRRISGFVVALCLLLVEQAAFAITIDSLQSDQNISTETEAAQAVSSVGALGGARRIYAKSITNGTLLVKVVQQDRSGIPTRVLSHSQEAGETAETLIIWDGSADTTIPAVIDYDGLGGIDLTADNASQFIMDVISHNPSNSGLTELTLTVYDATDLTGNTYARTTITPTAVTFPGKTFPVPFSQFTNAASLAKAGAVTLLINGQYDDMDMRLAALRTDGGCSQFVPAGPYALDRYGICCPSVALDECNVCGGNNAAKDQCDKCFGNNEDLDDCGVCFGGNKNIDDCGVCGGNNLSKDVCGICGGNGSTCIVTDCKGVPGGTAVPDRCGVCDGDGQSYLGCAEVDASETMKTITKGYMRQERWLKALVKVGCQSPADRNATIQQASKVVNAGSESVSELPVKVTSCTNDTFCTSISLAGETSTVANASKQLFRLSRKTVNQMRQCPGNISECKGDPVKCAQGLQARMRKYRQYINRARRIHADNVTEITKLPAESSSCCES